MLTRSFCKWRSLSCREIERGNDDVYIPCLTSRSAVIDMEKLKMVPRPVAIEVMNVQLSHGWLPHRKSCARHVHILLEMVAVSDGILNLLQC
jgi:hypothetical protein